jgi:protein gp37
MSAGTSIQWATDSWNFLAGCTKVSRGCRLCYAARLSATCLAHTKKYEGLALLDPNGIPRWSREIRIDEKAMGFPLKWRKGKEEPRRIFVNSMSDLFHEEVDLEVIIRAFDIMASTPDHRYLILTKRPERMASVSMSLEHRYGAPLPNVALGTSIEGVKEFEERIDSLRASRTAIRFLSVEPLLEPLGSISKAFGGLHPVDWVIVGGESGPRKIVAPFDLAWAIDLRVQCRGRCAYFFKQPGTRLQIGGIDVKSEGYTREVLDLKRPGDPDLPGEFPCCFRY